MSQTILASLQSLRGIRGVNGACLHLGPNVMANLLPSAFSTARVGDFCKAVHAFFQGYKDSGRDYDELCINFNGGTVYAVESHDYILSYLLENTSPIPLLGSASKIFLIDNKEKIGIPSMLPSTDIDTHAPTVWPQFQQQLLTVLGKVIGTASSQQLFSRVLRSMGGDAETGLPPARFKEFAYSLALEIPHRAKQEGLRKEIDAITKTISD